MNVISFFPENIYIYIYILLGNLIEDAAKILVKSIDKVYDFAVSLGKW